MYVFPYIFHVQVKLHFVLLVLLFVLFFCVCFGCCCLFYPIVVVSCLFCFFSFLSFRMFHAHYECLLDVLYRCISSSNGGFKVCLYGVLCLFLCVVFIIVLVDYVFVLIS